MIRSLFALVALTAAASVSQATTLTCKISYFARESGMIVRTVEKSANFYDENEYEPSLPRVAATVYATDVYGKDSASVIVRADQEDPSSNVLKVMFHASYVAKRNINGQDVNVGTYSEIVVKASRIGEKIDLGGVGLPQDLWMDNEVVSDVRATCVTQ